MDSIIKGIYSFSFSLLGIKVNSDDLVGTILNLLSTATLFNSSKFSLYSIVAAVNQAIVPVGESLLTLFFFINIIKMSQEGVERITWERIVLKAALFFMLLYFIQHSLDWFKTLANVVEDNVFDPLKGVVGINGSTKFGITDTLVDMMNNGTGNTIEKALHYIGYFISFFVLAIPYIATLVMIISQVFLRAIKLMIYMMFSPIPIALAAEGEVYRGKAITFFMQFVGVCFEAVIIYIGTYVYYLGVSKLTQPSGTNDVSGTFGFIIAILFMNGLFSAIISMASQLSERFLSRG